MWAMAVVMCDEQAYHMVEMFAIEDQEPIQTFRTNGPHEPLRDAVRPRRTKGRENDLYVCVENSKFPRISWISLSC